MNRESILRIIKLLKTRRHNDAKRIVLLKKRFADDKANALIDLSKKLIGEYDALLTRTYKSILRNRTNSGVETPSWVTRNEIDDRNRIKKFFKKINNDLESLRTAKQGNRERIAKSIKNRLYNMPDVYPPDMLPRNLSEVVQKYQPVVKPHHGESRILGTIYNALDYFLRLKK